MRPRLFPGSITLSLALCARLFAQPTPPAPPPAAHAPVDAIIVGAGIAGLSAAWELAQGGAKVIVVDMASVFGGHAVMSEGLLSIVGSPLQASKGIPDTPDFAFQDFVAWGEDPNPEWVRYYVDHSRREIYDWLTGFGVKFAGMRLPPGNRVLRVHETAGRGLALVTPIYRECLLSSHITFHWNLRVDRLLKDERRITGIAATNVRTGSKVELSARAVILATGGFQSNLALVREVWPSHLPFPDHFLIGSGINSLGSGLQLARDVGGHVARLDHQWNYVTGLPDPRFPGLNRGLNARNDVAIWVNTEGRRFIAEHTSTKFALETLLRQKGQTYWAIFDEAAKQTFWVAGSDWANFSTIEKWILSNPRLAKSATTLGQLANMTGLPPAELKATVARHNTMVGRGVDEDFGRFGPDKAFKPKRIMTPPFYAVQFFPITRKSMGGVVIDLGCRVQDAEGKTIPGLYAAGEVTGLAGINGKAGLEGTFLGPSIVTGRVAGRTVLTDQGRRTAAAQVAPRPVDPVIKPDPLATTPLCLSCHELPKLIASPRPGYWHFEKVHREVVAAKRDCIQCHAELTPTFAPETHRINRLAQIQNCATCHKGEDR